MHLKMHINNHTETVLGQFTLVKTFNSFIQEYFLNTVSNIQV